MRPQADIPPIFLDHFRSYCRLGTRLCIGLFACFMLIFMLLGIWPMVLATLAIIAMALWAWDAVPLLKPWQFILCIIFISGLYNTLVLWAVGASPEFHIYYLAFLTLDPAAQRRKLMAKVLMSLGIILLFVVGDHWGRGVTPLWPIAAGVIPIVRSFNFFGFCVFIAAIAYYDARTRERLTHSLLALATTDPLTGLLNRRRMEEFVAMIQNSHARHRRPFTLILGDIDHFKAINDRYGHETGDLILKSVAQRLLGSVRAEDQVARWGGEEFLILLPETHIKAGIEAAERIRSHIFQIELHHDGTPILATMTLGVAEASPDESFTQALGRADGALYRGKAAGRNRVEAG